MGRPQLTEEQAAASHERRNALTRARMVSYRARLAEQRQAELRAILDARKYGIIYAPQGQAGEYSALAVNPYHGCGHQCLYCYVPDVIRITRAEFDKGALQRKGFTSYTSSLTGCGSRPQTTSRSSAPITTRLTC
jgi:hypothetical protein